MSSPKKPSRLPDSRHSPVGSLHDKKKKKRWAVSGLSLKLHSPTFPHLFPPCLSLLPLLSYSNGLALFTQQHAICSKARWSDLGGMLRGLKEYEYFTRWLVCAKEEEGTERIQACLCAMWVWAEERKRERLSRHQWCLADGDCPLRNDMLYPTAGIHRWVKVHPTQPAALWAMHELPDSSCVYIQIRLIQEKPAAVLPPCLLPPPPPAFISPLCCEQRLGLKGLPPPPLPPSSASTSVERWQEVSLFYCLRFCGSLFHTPALHVHGDQRCCSLCNCAD